MQKFLQNPGMMDVWIIGGGLSGLTAGVALAREGVRVGVLEGSSVLGGRAQSWQDPVTGEVIDLGPHVLLSTYPNMRAFLEACGTRWEDAADWQTDSLIDQMAGEEVRPLRYAPMPAPFHFVPSLLRMPGIRFSDLVSQRALLSLAISLKPGEELKYDHIPALTLLRRMGVSEGAIDHLWRFIGMSILNVPLEECSGAALVRFARFLMGRRDFRIGFPKQGLGELFADGATRVIREAGGQVLLNSKVVRLGRKESGDFEIQIQGAGAALPAKRVILALAPQEATPLLAQVPAWQGLSEGVGRLEPCPYVSLYLKFDRKVTDRRFWARTHREGDLNCDFYDLSNIRPSLKNGPSIVASNIIYSHRVAAMSEQEILDRTLFELRENIPGTREAKLVASTVNRIPMAIHCPKPGAESLRPEPALIPGRFHLAGDWVRTELPSSMESACASGWMAARGILESVGASTSRVPNPNWAPPLLVRSQANFWAGVMGVRKTASSAAAAPANLRH